ncbi:Signal transduction histidine kinase NarQ [Commensalibacter communis]|uniref:Sensor protein n=1 Tax=Commensalibacter communis TaxID=2972786 RepID=A0A9W4TNE6_9PROT|nr:histidine kinase [Commensalibacter communis]CAI3938268.1 Signal transduction histidine kinase NarQ [Commensalibacter communis]CAI3942071.1 Signal transduction histidine kinase NarQ [Commensalibacter communis]CAI3944557.1 Signal transduction histidine kinase NarQ [Commensalibacter communis]CAI3945196.1 Signal transduction histidine kinase NarQ [Commensalibacter communis]
MTKTSRRHSLSVKLLVSVILWVTSAIFFTGYALALLWQLENAGKNINYAGSLRMKMYHMLLLSSQPDHQKDLQSERNQFVFILNNLLKSDKNNFIFPNNTKIDTQIQIIQQSYTSNILPILNQSPTFSHIISTKDLLTINQFVGNINYLVKIIENQNTQNIIWLRFIQTVLIIMVIFTAFSAIYLLYRFVINPLTHLQTAIQQISLGNLSQRITITNKDEFNIVSAGFNKMADNLQDLYNNLEQKVSQKTISLEEKNHELAILYDMTTFLHESLMQETLLESFLDKIIQLGNADAGFIGLLNSNKDSFDFLYGQGLPKQSDIIKKCYFSARCFFDVNVLPKNPNPIYIHTKQQNKFHLSIPNCIQKTFEYFVIFPIWHNNNEIGMIGLYFTNPQNDSATEKRNHYLIKTLIKQLAISIENQHLTIKEKQLAVLEERNMIAQGLHDSIAQSLSFLNLQTQILEKAIDQQNYSRIKQNLNFIQKGIQECYEDVRELLLNFRTKINNTDDFSKVIQNVLDRFKSQTNIPIEVHSLKQQFFLTQQQQLQVVFILQEALSNIRKHSSCSLVQIFFKNDKDFLMKIQDNGVGFDTKIIQEKKISHVGISIMKERAEKIPGIIHINSVLHHGTTIELIIPQ